MENSSKKYWNIWAIALIVSVLINGILIGSHLARKGTPQSELRGPHAGQDKGRMNQFGKGGQAKGGLENLPRYMSRGQRKVFNEQARAERRGDLRIAMESLKEARVDLDSLLAQQPVDWAAVRTQMALIRTRRDSVAKVGDDSIITYLETLPEAERAELLEALKSQPRRGPRRR